MVGGQSGLELSILQAHTDDDNISLANLYYQAALSCEIDDREKYCFLMTHAYVYALDAGLELSGEIHARLVRNGRDA